MINSLKNSFKISVLLLLLICLQIFNAQAQSKNSPSSLNKISLRTADVKLMSEWYQSSFQFKKKKSAEGRMILEKNGFSLELIQEKNVVPENKLTLPDGMRELARFSKFGFVVNNLDELFEQMKLKKIESVGGVFFDDRLKFRTFLVKDLEGNLVQFFEPRGFLEKFKLKGDEWKAAFLMIITDDAQRTINWYKENLNFEEVANVDNPTRKIIHRTLFNGAVLLELAEITGKVATKEKYPEMWKTAGGIISVGFLKNGKLKSSFDDGNNSLEFK